MTPFIVYALPRSRTVWLSTFLTFGGWKCWHDVAAGMRSMDDVERFFARPMTGTVETAAAPGWRLLEYRFPALRRVVVRRPVADVIASVDAAFKDIQYDADMLRRFMQYEARLLDQIAARPGVLAVDYADLARGNACAAVFEHCLGQPMPHEHWLDLKDRNIQVNMHTVIAYRLAHRREIEAFKRCAKADLWRLARARMITA